MAGTVKKLQFSEGTDVGAPTDLSLATSTTTISEYANDAAYVSANGVATAGDVYINSTLKVFRYYTGSAWRNAVPAMDPADATKTFLIDISGNTANMSATLTFGATGNRVYTFPDITMTVASRAGTETFTNKTLTAPLITTNGSIDVTGAGTLAIGASVGANNLTLGGAATTVVVAGNLQVDGTTTTVNSTTLEVADAAILVNNGGNDASSEGAGITVERTGTSGSFIYKNTSASKWACGPLGSELDVVTVSATQGISNKTVTASDIDGGTASNTSRITLPKDTLANLTALTRKQGTLVHDTTSNKPYYDDGSLLKAFGSGGGGSGGKNYLSDNSDGSTVGTVGSAVVSDTGNRASGLTAWQSTNTANISISSSGTTPLRDTSSFLTTGSGNAAAGTTFIETPAWQLDTVDLGKALLVSFDCSGNTTAADWDVCVVRYNSSGTYQEKLSVAGTASTGTPASAVIPTGTTTFRGFFVSGSTQTDYYALRFRRLAGTTNIRLDTLTVGPQSIGVGASLTDWVSFTPTGSWNTNSTYTGKYRRVGSSLEMQIKIALSGAPNSGALTINMPFDLTIDTTNITDAKISIGKANFSDSGGNPSTGDILYDGDATQFRLFDLAANATFLFADPASFTSPFTFGSGDAVFATVNVPVSQWSTGITMADRAVEVYAANTSSTDAADTTSFANGPAGSAGIMGVTNLTAVRKKRIQFPTPILPTDRMLIEYQKTATDAWMEVGTGVVASYNYVDKFHVDVATSYGVGIDMTSVSGNQVDLVFGLYPAAAGAASYGAATGGWSGSPGFLRVRKVAGGASVGYPISAANVLGATNGAAVASSYIGETISQTRLRSAALALTSTTPVNLTATPLTLTPGVWRIVLFGAISPAFTTTFTTVKFAISKTSATLPATDTFGVPTSGEAIHCWERSSGEQFGNDRTYSVEVPSYSVSSNTDIYLVVRADFATSTSSACGSIFATRIA